MIYIDWLTVYEALDRLIHNAVFWLLIVIVIIDFITGTIKAFVVKDVSSSTGINGLLKHTTVLLIVTVMGVITILSGYTELKYIFILFYVFEYSISIIENLDKIGVPFPERVSKMLRQWQEENNKGGK